MENSKELLQIKEGRKTFNNQIILDAITLDIREGEFITLLGASGSGKTTLLRLLAGLETWTTGTFQRPPQLDSAFVFQEAQLLPWRSVLANTLLPLELQGETATADKALAILKTVQLETEAQKFPDELSGGMKMRASIARALITKPRLLFMDEPFAALDEPTREELQVHLRQLWNQNQTTIIFVTHSLSEAVFLSDRIVVLGQKPSHIVLDHKVPLPLDRTTAVRNSLSYFEAVKTLREKLQNLAKPSGDSPS